MSFLNFFGIILGCMTLNIKCQSVYFLLDGITVSLLRLYEGIIVNLHSWAAEPWPGHQSRSYGFIMWKDGQNSSKNDLLRVRGALINMIGCISKLNQYYRTLFHVINKTPCMNTIQRLLPRKMRYEGRLWCVDVVAGHCVPTKHYYRCMFVSANGKLCAAGCPG